MININNLYIDLGLVLNTRTKLENILSPLDIDNIKKEYIKRTELFKHKSKNKFIQNF